MRARMEGKASSTPTPTIGPRRSASWGKMISAPSPAARLKRQGCKADQTKPLHADHAVEQRAASRFRDREASEKAKGRDLRGIARKSDRRGRRDEAGRAGHLEQEPERRHFVRWAAACPEDHALKAYRIERILQPVDDAGERDEHGIEIAPHGGDVSPVHALIDDRNAEREQDSAHDERQRAVGNAAQPGPSNALVLHQAGPRPSGERRILVIVQSQVSPSRVKLTFFPSAKERDA